MTEYDIVHVAVAPPNILDADLVKKVAAIINVDISGTRLLLGGKIPRIVAYYRTMQAAESVAHNLKTLGLLAIVCSDSQLRKHSSTTFRAHRVKLGEGEVIFWNKDGEAKITKAENVFLILKGTMQNTEEKETTKTRMKFSLPATLLTGGIPIWRNTKEKVREASIQTEYFVRLYDRISPHPSVEIFQYDLDYSFLGTKMVSSSLANFNTIVVELKSTFPKAVFDDTLASSYGANARFVTLRNDNEVNCKLIYLYHQAQSSIGPS